MRLSSQILLTIGVTLLSPCFGQERGGVQAKMALPRIMFLLGDARLSGSLGFWGQCNLRGPDFPKLEAPNRSKDSPVRHIQTMFIADPQMKVTKDSNGIIRMMENDVPRDLLDVQIGQIEFDSEFDPVRALHTILWTKEVKTFMKEHDIGAPSDFEAVIYGAANPSPESPRLSGTLKNVTLSQALDYITKTFPGLWVYENCASKSGKRVVIFRVYQNADFEK
jgi:hypothetical protein